MRKYRSRSAPDDLGEAAAVALAVWRLGCITAGLAAMLVAQVLFG